MSSNESANGCVSILAPLTGRAVPLEQVPDPVFSQKIIGDGIAVIPTEGKIGGPGGGGVGAGADSRRA